MKLLSVILISFLSLSWSAVALVFMASAFACSSGELECLGTQLDFSVEDVLVFPIDVEVTFTVGSCFDSDNFEMSVDATTLLDDDEKLDDDNFFVAQDDGLASGSNSTIIVVEGTLNSFLTRDVTAIMMAIVTLWFFRHYQRLRSYVKVLRSNLKTWRIGSFGLCSVCAILLLLILLLLTRGAKATLASPVRNEVEYLSSCNGAEDTDNPNDTVTTCSSYPSLCQHSSTGTDTGHNSSHNGHLCPSGPLDQPSCGVCDPMKDIAMDSLTSLKKAFSLFKISPGSFPSCAAHDYPFINNMKGILKQFCSVALVNGESATLDSSNSSSMPQQDWKAAPSSLPSTLPNWCPACAAVLLLLIVVVLTLFVFRRGTRHIYNETGPVAEGVLEFVTLPNPVDGGWVDRSGIYRANAMPGIKPTKSCMQVDGSGDVFYCQQPSPVGLTQLPWAPVPTQPEMQHRQSTTTSHNTEMVVGMGKHLRVKTEKKEGQEANLGSPPRAAVHGLGCMAPYPQVFTALGGDDSQQP